MRRLLLVPLLLLGCVTSEYNPHEWYGIEQLDLSRYRRIIVKPVSISTQGPERNRVAYIGSAHRRALIREIEEGGRIEPVDAVGPMAAETLILSLAIASYSHTRERTWRQSLVNEDEGHWGYSDSEWIDLTWSIAAADTGIVVLQGESPYQIGGHNGGYNTLTQTRRDWARDADAFAKSTCQKLGIGPVPVYLTPTKWKVEVLAIERAHVDRFAARWRLSDEVDPAAMRRNLEEWGVPGNLKRLPPWESLSDRGRALLAAEVRVRESLARRADSNAESLGILALTMRADPALRESVHFLSAVVTGDPWVAKTYPPSFVKKALLNKQIGPHRVDYSLVLPVERAIEQGDDLFVEGGIVLDDRAELLAILVVRKLAD